MLGCEKKRRGPGVTSGHRQPGVPMGSVGLISPKSLSSDGEGPASEAGHQGLSSYRDQQASSRLPQSSFETDGPALTSQQGVMRTTSSTMRAEVAARLANLKRQNSGRASAQPLTSGVQAGTRPGTATVQRPGSAGSARPQTQVLVGHQTARVACGPPSPPGLCTSLPTTHEA